MKKLIRLNLIALLLVLQLVKLKEILALRKNKEGNSGREPSGSALKFYCITHKKYSSLVG